MSSHHLHRLANFAVCVLLAPSFSPSLEWSVTEALDERYCETFEHDFAPAVARWCPLVNHYFGDEWTHWALHVIECESGGDPTAANPRSSARGLFQQLGRYWDARAKRAGWEGADILDPEANVAVSANLLNGKRSRTSHWECKAPHAVP